MLTNLSIRDVILIKKLDLEFGSGLTVLTGETGAGKSIVLDSLALALGSRSEKGLVRPGAKSGTISVRFEPNPNHPALGILERQGVQTDGEIVMRRVIQDDGRSRSYVNDETVSVSLLKELGQALVEVHGQMDQHGLMDAKSHSSLLDLVGAHEPELKHVSDAFDALANLKKERDQKLELAERASQELDYLKHRLNELTKLAPETGEEENLAIERQRLQNQDKLLDLLNDLGQSLNSDQGVVSILGQSQRKIERAPDSIRSALQPIADAMERAMIEVGEADDLVSTAQMEMDQGTQRLEDVEDRLFALKDAARKYRVSSDQLPELLDQTQNAIETLNNDEQIIADLSAQITSRQEIYRERAGKLSIKRKRTAEKLTRSIIAEFPPLKLDRARFRVRFDERPVDESHPTGMENAVFEISTNPGQPFGALGKIASGGELSRLMLALKVVMSKTQTTHSMVFDEVDSGVGGATAAAVGERLAKLATDQQVLVVTHAPQVAAKANTHLTVTKKSGSSHTDVSVDLLNEAESLDEIARMISGEEVTTEAKAAAARLLSHRQSQTS